MGLNPLFASSSPVRAIILVLDAAITLEKAEDLLWRRETRNERSNRHYTQPSEPNPNRMVVESLRNFDGQDIIIYTKLGANISDLSAMRLADFAIASAKAEAGKTGKDGISYLISVKRHGISTPLMPAYEGEILRRTGASSLEEALAKCRSGDA